MATIYRLLSDEKKAQARKRARECYAETRDARKRKAYLVAHQRIRNPMPSTLEAYGIHTTDDGWVDEDGNLYGTDNQAGRPQKLVPRSDADAGHLVRRPFVPR